MAETNHSLSPNRAAERTRQHHAAVKTLALQSARQAVKRQLQGQGKKITLIPASKITELAKVYLAQHHVRLIAEAKAWIATSPYFAEWRLPPEVESVRNGGGTRTLAQTQPTQHAGN